MKIYLFIQYENKIDHIIIFISMSDSKLLRLISYLSFGFELATLCILQSSIEKSLYLLRLPACM